MSLTHFPTTVPMMTKTNQVEIEDELRKSEITADQVYNHKLPTFRQCMLSSARATYMRAHIVDSYDNIVHCAKYWTILVAIIGASIFAIIAIWCIFQKSKNYVKLEH